MAYNLNGYTPFKIWKYKNVYSVVYTRVNVRVHPDIIEALGLERVVINDHLFSW